MHAGAVALPYGSYRMGTHMPFSDCDVILQCRDSSMAHQELLHILKERVAATLVGWELVPGDYPIIRGAVEVGHKSRREATVVSFDSMGVQILVHTAEDRALEFSCHTRDPFSV